MSQTIQKTTSTPSALLFRQSWLCHKRFLGTISFSSIYFLLVSSGGEAKCGGDELECGHVCRCHGIIYGLLLFQGEEGLRRTSGICEEDAVKLILSMLSLEHSWIWVFAGCSGEYWLFDFALENGEKVFAHGHALTGVIHVINPSVFWPHSLGSTLHLYFD